MSEGGAKPDGEAKAEAKANLPTNPPTNPMTAKLGKILSGKLETEPEMLASLSTVSTFFAANTLRNRRNLRRDLESRSLETNLGFLEHFRQLTDKLNSVTHEIEVNNLLHSRLCWRRDLESRSVETNLGFLEHFRQLTDKLNSVTHEIEVNNLLHSRLCWRRDLESRSLETNLAFLEHFRQLTDKLNSVTHEIEVNNLLHSRLCWRRDLESRSVETNLGFLEHFRQLTDKLNSVTHEIEVNNLLHSRLCWRRDLESRSLETNLGFLEHFRQLTDKLNSVTHEIEVNNLLHSRLCWRRDLESRSVETNLGFLEHFRQLTDKLNSVTHEIEVNNLLHSRLCWRRDLESRSLETNLAFLEHFRQLTDKLNSVTHEIEVNNLLHSRLCWRRDLESRSVETNLGFLEHFRQLTDKLNSVTHEIEVNNLLHSRLCWRRDLESRSLETNLAFLEHFRQLTDKLNSVTHEIEVNNLLHSRLCWRRDLESRSVETNLGFLEHFRQLTDKLNSVTHEIEVNNLLHSRLCWRRDLESRSLETNLAFLEHFRQLTDKLNSVTHEIEAMGECCAAMSRRLEETKTTTRDLINQTTTLQNQTRRVEKKSQVVSAFLAAFQLRPDERRALRGTEDGGLAAEFFPALQRLREVHADCRRLVATDQHRAGLELMEEMGTAAEAAYEFLYRWIQRECRLLNADAVDAHPLLAQALLAMEERPALFSYSVDELTTARRNHLVRAFIDALTRGGPGPSPKPIELLSHDPLRYVGDMLGWIHQALASEAELAASLLSLCPGQAEARKTAILTGVSDGLCRPLKVRVEQVLNGENSPTTLYRLSNLVAFYEETLGLEEKAGLRMTLAELKDLSTSLFFTALTAHLGRLLERLESPGADLAAPPQLHQCLLLLRDVLESHGASLVPSDKRDSFTRIFAAVVEPLGRGLVVAGAGLEAEALAVFLLNSLAPVVALLSLYEFSGPRVEMLQAQMEAQRDVLVGQGAGLILARSGLSDAYHLAKGHDAARDGPMSQVKGLDAMSLTTAGQKFDLFLASPEQYVLPHLALLHSAKTREEILEVERGTMELVLEAYGVLAGAVAQPANGYPSPQAILAKSPDQVRSVLL